MVTKPETGRTARISKRTVDGASPEAERFTLWDTDLKGFGLRVSPTGTKTYVVRYRAGGGRRGTLRQLVIARHGVLTADQARDRAKLALAQVANGHDPQLERAGKRADLTMSELCDLYLAEGVALKKESTLKLDRIRIARHIKPRLGRMKIGDVARRDVERLMHDVASGKIRDEATPHTRGGKGAAARTVGLLGAIFTFAVDGGYVPANPTRGVKKFPDVKRERFLSPAEIGRLGDTLAAMEAEGRDARHIAIIRLLCLTGARKNEIAHLRWGDIDAEAGVLRLQDSKTGPRPLTLGAAALKVLDGLPRYDSAYVFPDLRDMKQPVGNLDWAWVGIRSRAELPNLRIHDLRHSFASAGLLGGHALPMIGKLLGHSHVSTTARYAHLADDPVRAAADRISETMAAALNPTRTAEVVPMKRGVR